MVSIISGTESRFKVEVQTSPAMVDVSEVEKVKIPVVLMLSQDETLSDFEKYRVSLKEASHVQSFGTMPYGLMSARCDFKDADMEKEYEEDYQMAVDFFAKHL